MPQTYDPQVTATICDVIAGFDPNDPVSLDRSVAPTRPVLSKGVEGMRVGVVHNLAIVDMKPSEAVEKGLARAAKALEQAGTNIIELDMPIPPSDYRRVSAPINRSESFAIHEKDFVEHRNLMGRSLREKLEIGMYMRAADYLAALRERRVLVERTMPCSLMLTFYCCR